MTEWLQLSDEERLLSLQQATARSGIGMKAIEKDWWVTLVLKAVFQTPQAKHILFKGGTSLSKCWNLIQRFSEDIDLSIERELLGFGETLSKSQVKKLKKVATVFTSTILRTEIEKQLLQLGVPQGMVRVIADPIPDMLPDIDPQTIRITYPSLLERVSYIEDSVKIEVSARSLKEPGIERDITSLLGEYMPGLPWSGIPFPVVSVHPKRTFLEKLFLLHEEFLRPAGQINFNRMSRHLYDIERVMDTEYVESVFTDLAYYEAIVLHRRNFIFKQGVDYDTHHPKTISFIPPAAIQDNYKMDYSQMKEQMIYGDDVPEFEVLMSRLTELMSRIKELK